MVPLTLPQPGLSDGPDGSQLDRFGEDPLPRTGFEPGLGYDVHLGAQQFTQRTPEPGQAHGSDVRIAIDQQIDVAPCVVLATGHASEHADIVCATPCGLGDDRASVAAELSP